MCAKRGIAPIHEAALRRNVAGTKWLLSNGAAVDSKTEIGFTALHFAVQSRSLPLAQLLIEHKANPAAASDQGTPTEMAKTIDDALYKYLAAIKPPPPSGSPLTAPVRPHRLTPPRTNSSATFQTQVETESFDEDPDDDDELIYSREDDEKEEVLPLSQRRLSRIPSNFNSRGFSVMFSKSPIPPSTPVRAPQAKPSGPPMGGPPRKLASSSGPLLAKRGGAPGNGPNIRTPPRSNTGLTPPPQAPLPAKSPPMAPPRGGSNRGLPRPGSGPIKTPGQPPMAPPRGGSARGGNRGRGTGPNPAPRAQPAQQSPPPSVQLTNFCTNCGAQRMAQFKFCGQCGHKFEV